MAYASASFDPALAAQNSDAASCAFAEADTASSAAAAADVVYLSDVTAGGVLYAAPSRSGDIVQILGFALASGYIFFNPDYTFVEI